MDKGVAIMLVDDNRIDLFIHGEVIKRLPLVASVTPFVFAGEALSYLEEHEASQWPDVILLDIHMPIMNGFDFLARYEQLPAASRQKCRVIMVSSSLDSEDLERANANCEIAGFLGKPLNVEKLKEVILEKR